MYNTTPVMENALQITSKHNTVKRLRDTQFDFIKTKTLKLDFGFLDLKTYKF